MHTTARQDTKCDTADPQFERKKSAIRAQKSANERNLKKCSNCIMERLKSCLLCRMSRESLEEGLRLLRLDTTTSCASMDQEIQAGAHILHACTCGAQEKLARIRALQVQITSGTAGSDAASSSALPAHLSLATLFGEVAPGSGAVEALGSRAPTTPTAPGRVSCQAWLQALVTAQRLQACMCMLHMGDTCVHARKVA